MIKTNRSGWETQLRDDKQKEIVISHAKVTNLFDPKQKAQH